MKQRKATWRENHISKVDPDELGDVISTLSESLMLESDSIRITANRDGTYTVTMREFEGWEEEE